MKWRYSEDQGMYISTWVHEYSLFASVCVCIHTYMIVCVCIYVHGNVYACMYMDMCIYTYMINGSILINKKMYLRTWIWHVCMYTYSWRTRTRVMTKKFWNRKIKSNTIQKSPKYLDFKICELESHLLFSRPICLCCLSLSCDFWPILPHLWFVSLLLSLSLDFSFSLSLSFSLTFSLPLCLSLSLSLFHSFSFSLFFSSFFRSLSLSLSSSLSLYFSLFLSLSSALSLSHTHTPKHTHTPQSRPKQRGTATSSRRSKKKAHWTHSPILHWVMSHIQMSHVA